MKKTITLTLILLLLFSFGCVKETENGATTGKSFKFTGNSGVTAEFQQDAPPATNFLGDPIEVALKITNRGAVDVASGSLQARLQGVAATEIFKPTTKEGSNDETLLAAELDPTTTAISLGTITYSPQQMFSAEYKPEIETEICFPYTTKVDTGNFWISSKQADLDKGKISSSDNSDAPVHVTKLEEFKGTNQARFQFTVENIGKGKIAESCFPEKKTEEAKETVEVNILEPRGAKCETLGGGSSGRIDLINKKKVVRCSIDAPKDSSYATPLLMELNYNYDLELSKVITIKNLEKTV